MIITAERLERLLLKAFADTAVEDTTANTPLIRQVIPFRDAGRPQRDHGLVLRFTDGTEAWITIEMAQTQN